MQLIDTISLDVLSPLLTAATINEITDNDTQVLTRSYIKATATEEETTALSPANSPKPLSKLEKHILIRGLTNGEKRENSEKYDSATSKILQGLGILSPFMLKKGVIFGVIASLGGTFYPEFKYLITSAISLPLKSVYQTLAAGILITRTLDLPPIKRQLALQHIENANHNHPLIQNHKLNQRQLIEKMPKKVKVKIKPILEREINVNDPQVKEELRQTMGSVVENATLELKKELEKIIHNESEKAERQRKVAALNRAIQEITGATILATIFIKYVFKDDKAAERFSIFSTSAINITQSIAHYQIGEIGFFAMSGNVAMGIIALANLFGNQMSPEDARHAQIISYLKHIDEMLEKIHKDMITGFHTIVTQNYQILNEIRSLSREIRIGNLANIQELHKIQLALLEGIDLYLDTSRQDKHSSFLKTIANFNMLIGKEFFPSGNDEDLYNSYMTDFYIYATSTASLTIFNSSTLLVLSGKQLQEKITTGQKLDLLIGLAGNVAKIFQIKGIPDQSLPNPTIWRYGVNNFLAGRLHGNSFNNKEYEENLKVLWDYGQNLVYVTSTLSQLTVLEKAFNLYNTQLLEITMKLVSFIDDQKTTDGEKLMAKKYPESKLIDSVYFPDRVTINANEAIHITEDDWTEYYLFDSVEEGHFNPLKEALRLGILKLQHVEFWSPQPGAIIIAHSNRSYEIMSLTFTEKAGLLAGLIVRFAQKVVTDPHIGSGPLPSTSLPRTLIFHPSVTKEESTWSFRINEIIKSLKNEELQTNLGLSENEAENFRNYVLLSQHRSFVKIIEFLLNGYQYKQKLLVANHIGTLLRDKFSNTFHEEIDKFECVTASLQFCLHLNWWRQGGETQSLITPFHGIKDREQLISLIISIIQNRNIKQNSISECFQTTMKEIFEESKKVNFSNVKDLPLVQSAPEVDIVRYQLVSYMKDMQIEFSTILNPIERSNRMLSPMLTSFHFFSENSNHLRSRIIAIKNIPIASSQKEEFTEEISKIMKLG